METITQYIQTGNIVGLNEYVLKTLQSPNVSRAKIIKNFLEILDTIKSLPNTLKILISICENVIAWATKANKNLLKQQTEYKLAQLYFEDNQCPNALQLISQLLRASKQMDDRLFAVQLQLLEANVHRKVKNITKARGAMTGAKVDANAIYIPPTLQAEIDMCSGFINGEEKDYLTAASYFYEAFENYHSLNMKKETTKALMYLMLMKLMQKNINEIEPLMNNKHVIIYAGDIQIVAIGEIIKTFEKRNVDEYNLIIKKYHDQLMTDEFVKENLYVLFDELIQENICRILEPYSCVELDHLAKLTSVEIHHLEKILRLMIVEDKINGIIDQNKGILILYDDVDSNKILSSGITLINELGKVVDSLSEKALNVIRESTLSETNQN